MVTEQPEENEYMLEAGEVSFNYAERPILESVSLTIRGGEVVGILGENGSGKTTLLRLMAGLLKPGEGKVLLHRRDIETYRRMEIAREIAVVAQSTELIFDFTVGEVVMMGRHPYIPTFGGESREDREKTIEAMERMGIQDYIAKPVTQLSAGEVQRVMIARSLAQETPILLLDEPTSSLDVRHQMELAKLLEALRSEAHLAIGIVSHDINLIAHIADRVNLLAGGRIVASGPADEIVRPDRLYETYGVRMRVEEGATGISVCLPWDDVRGGQSAE